MYLLHIQGDEAGYAMGLLWAGVAARMVAALWCVVVCCSVLQCVAVCCSVLQCAAVSYNGAVGRSGSSHSGSTTVCCSVLQSVALCCIVLQWGCCGQDWQLAWLQCYGVLQCVAVCCSVLQCVAVLWCVAVCCSVLQCVAVCCSVLQCYGVLRCAAVCYSVLHCAAMGLLWAGVAARMVPALWCVAVCCSVLQCVAVCCIVLQWGCCGQEWQLAWRQCYGVLQYVARYFIRERLTCAMGWLRVVGSFKL